MGFHGDMSPAWGLRAGRLSAGIPTGREGPQQPPTWDLKSGDSSPSGCKVSGRAPRRVHAGKAGPALIGGSANSLTKRQAPAWHFRFRKGMYISHGG